MDWIAEHIWICGSEETVLEKRRALNDNVGGFGEVIVNTHDFIDDPKPFSGARIGIEAGSTSWQHQTTAVQRLPHPCTTPVH